MRRYELSFGSPLESVALRITVEASDWRASVREGVGLLAKEGFQTEPSPESPVEVLEVGSGRRYRVTSLAQLTQISERASGATRRYRSAPHGDGTTGPMPVVSTECETSPDLHRSHRSSQVVRDHETRVELPVVAPEGLSRRPIVRAPGLKRVSGEPGVNPPPARLPGEAGSRGGPPPEGRAGDLLAAVRAALDSLTTHLPCELVCALMPVPDMSNLVVLASGGRVTGKERGARLVLESGLGERLIGRRHTVAVREASPLRWVLGTQVVARVEARSLLWIPVVAGGTVRAVLLAINATDPHGFSKAELAASRYLAGTVARQLIEARP
jgi:hypothetical protein